jgi:uncharacterized protein YkwD
VPHTLPRPCRRPTTAAVALLAALLATLLVPLGHAPADAAVTPAARTTTERAIESRLFDGHNQARVDPGSYGYGSLGTRSTFRFAEDLAQVARAWSDEMARTGVFRHNPNYSQQSCCWVSIGENIAWVEPLRSYASPAAAADHIMRIWMDSKSHRDNIMNAAFTQVGIGVKVDANGRVWATAVLRRPDSDAPAGTVGYPSGSTVASPEPRAIDPACPARVPSAGFTDVTGADRLRAVNCLAWWDVTKGVGGGLYAPADTVTRGQMATFIARAIERSGRALREPTRHHFRDVPRGDAHARAINQLVDARVIDGFTDGTFRPTRTVTRAQMAKFLVAGFEHRTRTRLPVASQSWFADTTGHTLEANIDQIVEAGWATGHADGTYRPGNGVRRDQMAYFLTRWLSHLVEDGYAKLPS